MILHIPSNATVITSEIGFIKSQGTVRFAEYMSCQGKTRLIQYKRTQHQPNVQENYASPFTEEERERGRDRDRQRERGTDRQTDRESERETERATGVRGRGCGGDV